MSKRPLDPWKGQPPDWERELELLAFELSQPPDFEALTTKDLAACVDRMVARIRLEVADPALAPPQPSPVLLKFRIRRCLRDRMRTHWSHDERATSIHEGDWTVSADESGPCVNCIAGLLEATERVQPDLVELATSYWFGQWDAGALSDRDKQRLSRLKRKIQVTCGPECAEE